MVIRTARQQLEHGIRPSVLHLLAARRPVPLKASTTLLLASPRLEILSPLPSTPPPTRAHVSTSSTRPARNTSCFNCCRKSSLLTSTYLRCETKAIFIDRIINLTSGVNLFPGWVWHECRPVLQRDGCRRWRCRDQRSGTEVRNWLLRRTVP